MCGKFASLCGIFATRLKCDTRMLLFMNTETRKSLGDRLRILREERNLTQKKFALMIGMDRSQYAKIENGKTDPGLSKIEKIAGGMGLSMSDLLFGIGQQYEDGRPLDKPDVSSWVRF